MRSGSLRERMKVERRTRVEDGFGGIAEGWEVCQCGLAAKVIQKTGKEQFSDDTLQGVVNHEIHLRHSKRTQDIDNHMRLINERTGTIHNVRAATHDPRRRVVVLITQTGVRT